MHTGILFALQGRAVKTATALDEGLKYVIHVDNPRAIKREEDGKLVHLTGLLQTDQVLVMLCDNTSKSTVTK